jgi:hypothetical protein
LSRLEAHHHLRQGGQYQGDHATCQPKAVFLPSQGVEPDQQAVLALIVADGQLVNVHSLILGNPGMTTKP